ncbi:MAG: heparin lyase I family protein [Devosiaceae bacterium]|nr:heparin lyase I family protein [Devosiaceae bacterium]
MIRLIIISLFSFAISQSSFAQNTNTSPRTYETSFESIDDFKGFYITPQRFEDKTFHEQSSERVRSGKFAHKGVILGQKPPSTRFTNNNHRGYPTIQLYKLEGGAFKTPAKIEFWVWLDMKFKKGEWFSFATIDHTRSDTWDPVLVNLSDKGIVHLMHVPKNAQSEYSFQTKTIKFPMRKWVKLSIEIHFDRDNGYAKVWQNDQLVSSAIVKKGNGLFTQAHFGLYAPPSMTGGVVYNDDLKITELPRQ